MHIAVGGETLSTDGALVGPLAAVNQHVAVQGAGRAQGFAADTARVVSRTVVLIVLEWGGGQTEPVSAEQVPSQRR